MKFNRLLSLVLSLVMVFSMSVDVFAAINVNTGTEVVQVETSADQFFNVTFASDKYEPNAEEVYYMHMGQDLAIWRHSGDMNKSEAGSQNWNTPWGYKSDRWVQELMRGDDKGILLTLNQQIPWEVRHFLENGGTWEDIKITFQCIDRYGTPVNHEQVFKNGKVDGWLKWGSEIQLSFYPLFHTDTKNYIYNGNTVKLNRGMYPYSFTMFSMWSSKRQYGATRIWDSTFGEPDIYTQDGYKPLQYTDILSNSGDIASGYYKNVQYSEGAKTETGHKSEPGISGDVAGIGLGTFSSGGATGLGFNFPVRVTFEINPVEDKGNQMYLSEYSIVSMSDNAEPDELTTHAALQAYSNKAQLTDFVGGKDAYDALAKVAILKALGSEYAGVDDKTLQLFVDNTYTADLLCTLMDMSTAGEIKEVIQEEGTEGFISSNSVSKMFDKIDKDFIDKFREKIPYAK